MANGDARGRLRARAALWPRRSRRVHARAAPGRHDRLADARDRGRNAAGCRSTRSGSTSPPGCVSSLVMTAVPARVAGVSRIAVATPRPVRGDARDRPRARHRRGLRRSAAPRRSPRSPTGRRRSIRVAKIVGPGNRWVTAAKLLVSAAVAIDLPAGPSEVLVIADETADPAECAADLLAQAEHGPDGESVLVTTSAQRRRRGRRTNGRHASGSSWWRASTTRSSARTSYAPEHLELLVADPDGPRRRRAQRGRRLPGHDRGARRLRRRLEPCPPDGRHRASHGRARSRGVPQAGAVRPRDAAGLAATRETVETFAALEDLRSMPSWRSDVTVQVTVTLSSALEPHGCAASSL